MPKTAGESYITEAAQFSKKLLGVTRRSANREVDPDDTVRNNAPVRTITPRNLEYTENLEYAKNLEYDSTWAQRTSRSIDNFFPRYNPPIRRWQTPITAGKPATITPSVVENKIQPKITNTTQQRQRLIRLE